MVAVIPVRPGRLGGVRDGCDGRNQLNGHRIRGFGGAFGPDWPETSDLRPPGTGNLWMVRANASGWATAWSR